MAKYRRATDGDRDVVPVSTIERFCGNFLNCISDAEYTSNIETSSRPFGLRFISDGDDEADNIALGQQGFRLAYNQVPC